MTVPQLVHKSPSLYAAWKFITVFTTACHFPLSSARLILSKSYNPITLSHISVPFSNEAWVRFSFVTETLYSIFPSPPNVPHVPPITTSSISSPKQYPVSSTNREAPHCTHLSRHPVLEPPQPNVLHLNWETKFHTHTKQQTTSASRDCHSSWLFWHNDPIVMFTSVYTHMYSKDGVRTRTRTRTRTRIHRPAPKRS